MLGASASSRRVRTEPLLRPVPMSTICTQLTPEARARAGLRLIAKLAPDSQGRLSVDEPVHHAGRNQLFLAASNPRLDGKRRLDVGMVLFHGVHGAGGAEWLSRFGHQSRSEDWRVPGIVVQAAICS